MSNEKVKINSINTENAISVADYINYLNNELKSYSAKIIGEVGSITISTRGHVYFSLKDQNKEYTIRCIIWKWDYKLFGIDIKEGMELIITGHPNIYEIRGDLSFITETIELVGEGKLKAEYEKLKKKLEKEGIFNLERKRPIPQFPQKIGIITSRKGAVIEDFLNNLGKFGFKVKMIDTAVEGQKAVKPILSAIKIFKKQDIDVLVIMRGGGSMESLIAFNNEVLVRELANFPVPIITGIGHHKDVPLIALVADKMESTPTATTNVLNKSWNEADAKIDLYKYRIIDYFNRLANNIKTNLDKNVNLISEGLLGILNRFSVLKNNLRISLAKINYSLKLYSQFINNKSKFIISKFKESVVDFNILVKDRWISSIVDKYDTLLSQLVSLIDVDEKIINSNNPLRQLRLGYSIIRKKGLIIRNVKGVKIGDDLDLQLSDGSIISNVKKINKF